MAVSLIILTSPSITIADCTCSIGSNGINIVGFELIATQCPVTPFSDTKTYVYIINPIECNGITISAYSSYGDTTGSPSSIISYYISSGYRVIRNESGTHLIAVQKGKYPFSGLVSGVNMATAPAGIYYTTPSTLMNKYCTATPVSDYDNDGIPDCLEQPELDLPLNFGGSCSVL